MIPNAYLSVNKTLLTGVLLVASFAASAQRNKPKLPGSDYKNFLNTQWWLGVRVGMNYAQPDAVTSYTSIDPIDYETETLEKTYDSFNLPGVLIGLDISFYHRGFSLGIQPSFKQMRYSYASDLEWLGQTEAQRFETMYETTQKLSYLEMPLTLKYEILQSKGKARPFIMAGLNYSIILDAEKKTEITHTDYMSGTARPYDGGSVTLNIKDQFQNYYGAIGGVGVAFDFFNIRTVLEATYMYALSSVANTNNRFNVTELTTLGEVNDEINLNNINVSLSFVFPLRYIDKTFQAH